MEIGVDYEGINQGVEDNITYFLNRLEPAPKSQEEVIAMLDEKAEREIRLKKILEVLLGNNPHKKDVLSDQIYRYHTYRCDLRPLVSLGITLQDDYLLKAVKALALETSYDESKLVVSLDMPFFQIGTSYDKEKFEGEVDVQGKKVPVMWKQYFGFRPSTLNPEENQEEVSRFLRGYVQMAERIRKAGIEHFATKTYSVLWHLLQRRENIAIYHGKPEDGAKIQEVVKATMQEYNVPLEESNLTTNGFDIRAKTSGFTYNKMISDLTGYDLMREHRKRRSRNNPLWVEDIIRKDYEEMRGFTPEKFIETWLKFGL